MTARPQPAQHGAKYKTASSAMSALPFEIDSITDYMAPFLPSHQAALASLSLSASLLHCPSPAHLLASSYLLQRKRHYSTSAFAQLLTSLAHSSTLYIGNLSFTTREEQLFSTFQLPTLAYPAGLHMGLNSLTKQPCGFAFVAFATAQQAQTTRAVLHTLAVDERTVGIDMDQTFKPGREWGRGKSGGQIRDEVRQGWDKGRGGWGARERRQQQMREMKEQQKSTFKRMGEGQEQREAEEEAAGQQQQRAKREHGSYAHAQAMRRAGAAKTTEAEMTDDEADRAAKRQKVNDDEEVKQPLNDNQQQPTSTETDSVDGGNEAVDEGDSGGAYWDEAAEEQKGGEDVEWDGGGHSSPHRLEEPQQAEEEDDEAEHGFAGEGGEDNDEPQWT